MKLSGDMTIYGLHDEARAKIVRVIETHLRIVSGRDKERRYQSEMARGILDGVKFTVNAQFGEKAYDILFLQASQRIMDEEEEKQRKRDELRKLGQSWYLTEWEY